MIINPYICCCALAGTSACENCTVNTSKLRSYLMPNSEQIIFLKDDNKWEIPPFMQTEKKNDRQRNV